MKKEKKFILHRDSVHSLWILFKSGNTMKYYSLDWRNQYTGNLDPQLGLERFEKLIKKFGEDAKIARIYSVKEPDKMIKEFKNGIEI